MYLLCVRYLSGASQVALVVRNLSANVGDIRDAGSIPGSPGGGHGNPLQYSCLENPHGQRSLARYSAWVAKSRIRLERLCMHARRHLSMMLSSLGSEINMDYSTAYRNLKLLRDYGIYLDRNWDSSGSVWSREGLNEIYILECLLLCWEQIRKRKKGMGGISWKVAGSGKRWKTWVCMCVHACVCLQVHLFYWRLKDERPVPAFRLKFGELFWEQWTYLVTVKNLPAM